MTTTETPTTTHVVLGMDNDNEQTFVYEGGEGDAEDRYDAFEADVPTELVAKMNAGWRMATEAIEAIGAAAGYDAERGRMLACCPVWRGYEHQGQEWWQIVVASVSEDQWPAHDAVCGHHKTEHEARAVLESLPDTFVVAYGTPKLVTITKDRLTIEHKGFGGTTSECYGCGWERGEHADPGTPS